MKMKSLLPAAALCLALFPLAPAALAGAGTWENVAPMLKARYNHTATLLGDGTVLVAGGEGPPVLASTEFYTPGANGAAGTWAATTGMLTAARYEHTATLLKNGKVLVAGGQPSSSSASADLYDPNTKTWGAATPLLQARYGHTATLLGNELVLVAGGYGPVNGGANTYLTSAELFKPAGTGGAWVAATPLLQARSGHTATLLADGKVLVAGGYGPVNGTNQRLASAEIYAWGGAGGSWVATGAMNTARYGHTATLLGNGKVLVAGGEGSGTYLASAEIYDPDTGTWSPVASMKQARTRHTATLLGNGTVLVAGGYEIGTYLASAEIYDPVGNTWSEATAMGQGRFDHTATLLTDGRVLVAGGFGGTATTLSSAEIYDPNGVPATPTPTPTPTTTGGSASRPAVAITGKKKLTTTKASVRVKGTATGAVTAVQVKAGKKSVKAAGTTSWSAKVKVKPGVNRITAVATGPGGTSAPAKMKILRR